MAGAFEQVFWEFGTLAKTSATRVYIPELNAGNFAAQAALWAAFLTAISDVSIGNSGTLTITALANKVLRNPSLNVQAQREKRWLVSCEEAGTGNIVTYTVPCADLTLLASDGVNMDPASPEYAELVTASNALVRSNDGNTTAVRSVVFRARTL